MLLQSLAILLGTYFVVRFLQYRLSYWPLVRQCPGSTTLVLFGHPLSFILPDKRPLQVARAERSGRFAFAPYDKHQSTVVRYSAILLPQRFTSDLLVADAHTAQQVAARSDAFPKPLEVYSLLNLFGVNIVTLEGQDHRRHRRLVAPAFSEANTAFVFEETLRIMQDWMTHVAPDPGSIHHDENVEHTLLQITLSVISTALFGMPSSWSDAKDRTVPKGHRIAFRAALEAVLEDIYIRILTPTFVYRLPLLPRSLRKKLDQVDLVYEELELYLREMVQDRQNTVDTMSRDLLNLLVAARAAEGTKSLSDQELIGNIFMILVAGHETGAHALAFAFALLAINPEKQDALYEQTRNVWPEHGFPSFGDCSSFVYAQAVMQETLRKYPPVIYIPKVAQGDQVVFRADLSNPSERIPMSIPHGTRVGLDTLGIHHNPLYWKDPLVFQPERFLDDSWPREAFLPFSLAGRSCIGQRFAQIEVTIALAFLSMHLEVSLPERLQRNSTESTIDHEERILKTVSRITLTPLELGLVFKRRS